MHRLLIADFCPTDGENTFNSGKLFQVYGTVGGAILASNSSININ